MKIAVMQSILSSKWMQALKSYLLLLGLLLFCHFSQAADKQQAAMSMATYKRLSAIEKLMTAQQYSQAQQKLNALLNNLPSKKPDQAYVYHMQGTLALHQEQYRKAQTYYRKVYQLDVFKDQQQANLLTTLANLAMHHEDYVAALRYLKAFIAAGHKVDKTTYLMMGTAHYQLNQFRQAIQPLEQARRQFAADKSVYSMLFACYYELRQLSKASGVLEAMLRHWPQETQYWLQLASIYLEQNEQSRALEILQLADTRGLLVKENELLQFVYTLYEKGLPFKAATVLKNNLDAGRIKTNHKNLRLLASLYVDAREDKQALKAFEAAARFARDGNEELYIAQLYLDKESYPEAMKYAKRALDKGLKAPGNAYMLLAAASHELNKPQLLQRYLQHASRYKATRKAANQWLQALN